ncbi:MAG: HAD family hydrolase [Gemmatimonadetes bacterium]|nr:HAD family hydrolase [Gemmatimonadota bacterium]
MSSLLGRRNPGQRDRTVRERLVLFDIDGTLLLSGGAGKRAVLRALHDETGIDAEHLERVRFDGKTDPAIVSELFHAAGRGSECTPTRMARVIERYLWHLEADLAVNAHRAKVMPGVASLLDRLWADRRLVVGLLTGNVSHGAAVKLRAVGIAPERFAVGAYGSDHPERSALPPIAVERARQYFGRAVGGREVVILGDTPADMTCGNGIGARAIGVTTGNFAEADLAAAGAQAVFADFTAVDEVHRCIAEGP